MFLSERGGLRDLRVSRFPNFTMTGQITRSVKVELKKRIFCKIIKYEIWGNNGLLVGHLNSPSVTA